MSAPDVGVVIVAAGSSSRTGDGELKQFRWIAGRPMLLHSLQLFQQRADVAMGGTARFAKTRQGAVPNPPAVVRCP